MSNISKRSVKRGFFIFRVGGLGYPTNSSDALTTTCRGITRDLYATQEQNITIRISIKQFPNIYYLRVYTMQYNRFMIILKLYKI